MLKRLSGRHFLEKIVENGKTLHRQCIVCSAAEKQMLAPPRAWEKRGRCGHMSAYRCKQCNMTLCITPCFKLYHTKQEFCCLQKVETGGGGGEWHRRGVTFLGV